MANLLSSPLNWATNGTSPPDSWDGSKYSVHSPSAVTSYFFSIALVASPAPGDTVMGEAVAGTIGPANSFYLNFFVRDEWGDPGPVMRSVALSSVTPTVFEVPAEPRLNMALAIAPDSTGNSAYGQWVEVTPTDAPTVACEEIGRVTRNFVSAHQRDRVHYSSLYASEKRCLVTNFNGAIPPGRTIASTVWQTWDTMNCVMSAPAVMGREVQVQIAAQYSGRCRIRVDATLDNGEVYSAWHVIRVQPAPYFTSTDWVPGPSRLEASAG